MPEMDGVIKTEASRLAMVVFALAALAGWAGSCYAQQPTQTQVNAIRQACRTDYQTYCASVPHRRFGSARLPQRECAKPLRPLSRSGGRDRRRRSGPATAGARGRRSGMAAPTQTPPAAIAPAAPAYRAPPPTDVATAGSVSAAPRLQPRLPGFLQRCADRWRPGRSSASGRTALPSRHADGAEHPRCAAADRQE